MMIALYVILLVSLASVLGVAIAAYVRVRKRVGVATEEAHLVSPPSPESDGGIMKEPV